MNHSTLPAKITPGSAAILQIGKRAWLDFAWIPPGDFWMGDDDDLHARPRHQVTLPGYWMGKVPVTNTNYRLFVDETHHAGPASGFPLDKDNHPVVEVTWFTAVVFARWLNEKWKDHLPESMCVRLPSEAEWEKAARGADGRTYPWGSRGPGSKLCNYRASKIDDTTAVGTYSPKGDSPYGCADMAGNVWEWTRSLWGPNLYTPTFTYPYRPDDGREDPANTSDSRVMRSGHFRSYADGLRCATRIGIVPGGYGNYMGFRVCIGPIPA